MAIFAFLDKQKGFAPYFPNVSMGWETSPRTVQSDGIANAGYPFTPAVRGGPQIIILNAWNEWTEGSYLELDTEYGMKYLEAIQSAACLPPELVA